MTTKTNETPTASRGERTAVTAPGTAREATAASEGRARRVYRPRVDLFETDTHWLLLADMPGVDESSVEVTLERNVLTMRGTPASIEPEAGMRLLWREFEPGVYERGFTLTDEIDRDSIEAGVKNGVVRVRLAKARPRTRKITIQKG
jgi:HSP20 family molecular chaperone IbpA